MGRGFRDFFIMLHDNMPLGSGCSMVPLSQSI